MIGKKLCWLQGFISVFSVGLYNYWGLGMLRGKRWERTKVGKNGEIGMKRAKDKGKDEEWQHIWVVGGWLSAEIC